MAVEVTQNSLPAHRPPSNGLPRSSLPNSTELEASILGGIIVRPSMLGVVPDLEIDDFYHLPHKAIFEAIRNLESSSRPLDVVMLEIELERAGKLDAAGGVAYLGAIVLSCPTADNVRSYADEIRLLSRNRKVIMHLDAATRRARDWPHEASELLSETIGELTRLEDLAKPPSKRLKLISIDQAIADLDPIAKAPVYPTPFEPLNDAIGFGGFLGTQVYTVAASTGRGKTTWVAAVAAHTASLDIPVIVATYEMKPGYFVVRKAAGVLGYHSNELLRGQVSRDRIVAAMPYERFWLMHNPTLLELREAAQHVAQKYGTAPLLVVDYIQKLADQIALTQQRPDLRHATSQASATLCDIADRTGCPVIAVSAIGRGKKKELSDPRKFDPYDLVELAKESGAVEYDGAGMIVLTLSRETDGDARIATMTAAKCRFGEECHIDARYNGKRGEWRAVARVEMTPRIEAKPDDGELAASIIRVIQQHGPQKSKRAFKQWIERRPEAINSELDAMLRRGTVLKIGGKFVVPSQVEVTAPQRQLAAMIRTVENDLQTTEKVIPEAGITGPE